MSKHHGHVSNGYYFCDCMYSFPTRQKKDIKKTKEKYWNKRAWNVAKTICLGSAEKSTLPDLPAVPRLSAAESSATRPETAELAPVNGIKAKRGETGNTKNRIEREREVLGLGRCCGGCRTN